MIKVKAAKAADTAFNDADPYAPRAKPMREGLPFVIGTAIVSIALYLKSMVTASAEQSDHLPRGHGTRHQPISSDHLDENGDIQAPEPKTVSDAGQVAKQADTSFTANPSAAHFQDITWKGPTISLGNNVIPLFGATAGLNASAGQRAVPSTPASPSDALVRHTMSATATADEATTSVPANASRNTAPTQRNRAPVNAWSVYLTDLLAGESIVIALASLLANTSDADADTLRVENLSVSSGRIEPTEGGFLYTPDSAVTGPVEITFQVSDGEVSVTQSAHFDILSRPLEGTSGDDHLAGTSVSDVISGNAGNDQIDAGPGHDAVYGGLGNDLILGGAGNDVLFGGAGDDTLLGQDGADVLRGNNGNDWLYGGAGDDSLDGGEGDDVVRGGTGHDVIVDSAGADTVFGDAGNDRVIASLDAANDYFDGDGDQLENATGAADAGGAASPQMFVLNGITINMALSELDVLDYSAARQSLDINFATGDVRGAEVGHDDVRGFEVILAGEGDDHFTLGEGRFVLGGGGGNDRFDFSLVQVNASDIVSSYQILDFVPGDVVETRNYRLFERDSGDTTTGINLGDMPVQADHALSNVRISYDCNADEEHTIVEMDGDDYQLAAIVTINGHHVIFYTEMT